MCNNLTCAECGFFGEVEVSNELQGLIDSEDTDEMFGKDVKCPQCSTVLTIDIVTIKQE